MLWARDTSGSSACERLSTCSWQACARTQPILILLPDWCAYFSRLISLSANGKSGLMRMRAQSAYWFQRWSKSSDRKRTVVTFPPAPISTMATRARGNAASSPESEPSATSAEHEAIADDRSSSPEVEGALVLVLWGGGAISTVSISSFSTAEHQRSKRCFCGRASQSVTGGQGVCACEWISACA